MGTSPSLIWQPFADRPNSYSSKFGKPVLLILVSSLIWQLERAKKKLPEAVAAQEHYRELMDGTIARREAAQKRMLEVQAGQE